MNEKKFVTTFELAKVFNKTPEAIRKLAQKNEDMPKYRLGRELYFDLEEIVAWMSRKTNIDNKGA